MKFFVLFFSFLLLSFSVQGQEDLYIKFNPENRDVYKGDDSEIWFHLRPKIDASSFIYDKKIDGKKEVFRVEIAERLVSKAKANEMAKAIREKESKEFEEETGIKGQPSREILFFRTFKKIYIFVPDSSGEKGILYPVSWRYALE